MSNILSINLSRRRTISNIGIALDIILILVILSPTITYAVSYILNPVIGGNENSELTIGSGAISDFTIAKYPDSYSWIHDIDPSTTYGQLANVLPVVFSGILILSALAILYIGGFTVINIFASAVFLLIGLALLNVMVGLF